ncbi:hypothetical protein GCM10025777_47090 [Membranihabitans marinus]
MGLFAVASERPVHDESSGRELAEVIKSIATDGVVVRGLYDTLRVDAVSPCGKTELGETSMPLVPESRRAPDSYRVSGGHDIVSASVKGDQTYGRQASQPGASASRSAFAGSQGT